MQVRNIKISSSSDQKKTDCLVPTAIRDRIVLPPAKSLSDKVASTHLRLQQLESNMPCGRSIDRLFKCFRQEKRYVFVISAVSIALIFALPSNNELTKTGLSLSTISVREKTTVVLKQAANISVAAGSLNTSVLLQTTINELEVDGWIAPIGKGGVSRRLWKMKAAMRIGKPDTAVQRTEEIVLTAERWKSKFTSCRRIKYWLP